jgi:hypothetical protein
LIEEVRVATLRSVPPGITQKAPQYGAEQVLRPAAALTMAYVVSQDDLDAEAADEVEVVLDFALGAGGSTGCRARLFTSDDLVTWVEQSVFDAATGVLSQLQVEVRETAVRSFRFVPGRRYVRASAVALTTGAQTSLRITARSIHIGRTNA